MKGKTTRKISRRSALQTGAGLALAGTLSGDADAAPTAVTAAANVYEAIGVKPVINATGTVTVLGGSVMPPEVVAAWASASRHFVDMFELHDKVGARIAKLLGVEAAMVTTGCAGAMLLGTAAVVTRGEASLIARLPDTAGMRNEVILQKAHRSAYDNQLADVGAKLIEVESAADVERAINERTALLFFMNYEDPVGKIKREEWLELARRHKLPTLLDAAADVPPVQRIAEYCKMGFDMVAVSGGKAMRGPNDTGILVGRKDLIEAAKRNTNPNGHTIGRMMKVSKEDMIAALAAVERFVRLDSDSEWREWERQLGVIEKALKKVPMVVCKKVVPPLANHVPHLVVTWDENRVKVTRDQVAKDLAAGEPSIRSGRVSGTGDDGLLLSVLTLQEGEVDIVADRLRALLEKAAS